MVTFTHSPVRSGALHRVTTGRLPRLLGSVVKLAEIEVDFYGDIDPVIFIVVSYGQEIHVFVIHLIDVAGRNKYRYRNTRLTL